MPRAARQPRVSASSRKEKLPVTSQPQTVTSDDIGRRAYELYLARGNNGGDPLDDWLRAERELASSTTTA